MRLGVYWRFVRYTMSSLRGCTTIISCGPHKTTPITIQRGVKQEDPISPMLFNAVMDELLRRYESADAGVDFLGAKVNVLAYTDDLILVSSSLAD